MILEKINGVGDIKQIPKEDLPVLAQEIRSFLVEHISVTGGHLASNLGVVELTMALHLVLDLPKDKLIWDVGHQSYTHKILTGRRDGFGNLRAYGGISGFPKRCESECDAFDTGHSYTSISAGLGYACARDRLGQDYTVVSVIGDGAMTGGMSFEALNNAARMKTNFIIVLNDNEMSISENVGGLARYLSSIRTAPGYTGLKSNVEQTLNRIPLYGEKMVEKIRSTKQGIKQLVVPGMFFEDVGIKYLGPVDGGNIPAMVRMFKEAQRVKGPVVVHVITVKGKGYPPAERHPSRFHATGPFDIATGLPLQTGKKATYTDVFATVMCKLAQKKPGLAAVTAAMPEGTGLKRFRNRFPDQFYDVGIAEQHAVTFCAGLAVAGLHPVFAVYSSFLQRAYDQIIHDVCLQDLPVTFAVDRAGLTGADGETHQGIFDLSYLSQIPNMTVMAPKNKWELADMLRFAVDLPHPCAIRYPRGEACDTMKEFRAPVVMGKSEVLYDESGIALLAVGSMTETARRVRDELKKRGFGCSLVNVRFVKPLDEALLVQIAKEHGLIVTLEENVRTGGFGDHVLEFLSDTQSQAKVLSIALPDTYIEHGSVDVLRKETCLDDESILEKIITCSIGCDY